MFQLYKKRNFNDLINDTFVFLKTNGKNYFSTYLAINAGPMLILMVLLFVVIRIFFEGLFNGLTSPDAMQMLKNYFNNNLGIFAAGGALALLLVIVLTLLNFSFPIIYLGLWQQNQKLTSQIILLRLKAKAGRILFFALVALITFVPLFIVIGILCLLLCVTIIGIPVAFCVMASITCWFYLSFYNYLNNTDGYFASMKNGYKMLTENYWAHMGTTAIFVFISFVLQFMVNLLTSAVSAISAIAIDVANIESNIIVAAIFFIISMAISYFFTNIVVLAHGMIYYSCKENTEHKMLYFEMDQIGNDGE
jgi:hypothetical protein